MAPNIEAVSILVDPNCPNVESEFVFIVKMGASFIEEAVFIRTLNSDALKGGTVIAVADVPGVASHERVYASLNHPGLLLKSGSAGVVIGSVWGPTDGKKPGFKGDIT